MDWLAGGVREKVEEAEFRSKHKPSRIARDLCDTGNCRQFTRCRLRRLVIAHIANVKRKRFGAGSHMTRALLHELLQNTPEDATKDTTNNTILLIGYTMKNPDQLCIVYGTLRWLRAARLHAAEAKKSGQPMWMSVDGT